MAILEAKQMSLIEYGEPKPSNISKSAIYTLAANLARSLEYKPGDRLDPIVDKLGGKISYHDFWSLEDSTSGSIRIDGEGNFEIFLAAHTGPARDRFTIAHEIGHYILHYLWPKRRGENIGPLQAARYGTGRVEYEANWFAAGFLMPEDLFRESFEKCDGDLVEIADMFGVSVSAATTRAKALNLIPS